MDRVRFGRALGYGARHAARALKDAAEAATSTDSAPPRQVPRRTTQMPQTPRPQAVISHAKTQGTQAGKSFLGSLKDFSGTVMLQVMGSIFGLFTIVLSNAAWRLHMAFHPPYNSPDALRLYIATGMSLLFLWFTVSSFIRANKVGKR